MKVNYLTIIIFSVLSLGIIYLITQSIRWGIIAGLMVLVTSGKWWRVKKRNVSDEVEYDERVINNMKKASFQTFSICNLILFIYLLISEQILNEYTIQTSYLLIYLSITFILSYYIVPEIVKRK